MLGHVIEDVTGLSYNQAVKKYLGSPVGAGSFFAGKDFRAPGARIHSSILDFAKFAAGVINHVYLDQNRLYNQVFQIQSGLMGLGWQIENENTPDLKAYHGGSNGLPQAYLIIMPRKRIGVVMLATAKNRHRFSLNRLSNSLLDLIEN